MQKTFILYLKILHMCSKREKSQSNPGDSLSGFSKYV